MRIARRGGVVFLALGEREVSVIVAALIVFLTHGCVPAEAAALIAALTQGDGATG